MRTKDEIVIDMVDVGIIAQFGTNYMLTEKYKELLTNKVKLAKEEPANINKEVLMEVGDNKGSWAEDISQTEGRVQAENFMNACEIPVRAPKGYRLRSLPYDCLRMISNIIQSDDIIPGDMIAAIKTYYNSNNDHVKTFKNLLLEGDVVDIYKEWVTGSFDPNINTTSSQKGW